MKELINHIYLEEDTKAQSNMDLDNIEKTGDKKFIIKLADPFEINKVIRLKNIENSTS